MDSAKKMKLPLPRHPVRVARRALQTVADKTRPVLAQLVVTRRCNLDCGYCNEYDDFSPPVPTEELFRRIDKLAELGTLAVTYTGGEPLLHPELDRIVDRIVSRGMVCTGITNGYPLTQRWIERLNDAGLSLVQISIDNLEPNEKSRKSWSQVKNKLELLKKHAKFAVNVNAVLGSCPPEETLRLAAEVRELGFFMTVGLMHDGDGQVAAGLAGDSLSALFEETQAQRRRSFLHRMGEGWERQMIRDGSSPWRCRAGARYLYIDEHGLVSYCSQRRGFPGIPLAEWGRRDLLRGSEVAKGCENGCTIACVRRASALDSWRPQRPAELIRVGVHG